MKKKVIFFILILVFIIVTFIYAISRKLESSFYTIESEKIDIGIKALVISDLHGSYFGNDQKDLIKAVNKINPDVIFLTGDIFDEDIDYAGSEKLLEEIGKRYICFYVTGNHEFWTNEEDELNEKVRGYNITVLEGETKVINVKGQMLSISGVDDLNIGKEVWQDQLDKCNTELNKSLYSILLVHRPELKETYEEYSFDLILSGHAHGGQVRIPFILNGLYAPGQGWFPKYGAGKYMLDNSVMIISRGLSKKHMPRVFNRPELVVVNLKPA